MGKKRLLRLLTKGNKRYSIGKEKKGGIMPSSAELVNLFNDGSLGKLIATTFGGERKDVCNSEDADLIVEFLEKEDVPDIQTLVGCADTFYSGMGYTVSSDVVGSLPGSNGGFVVFFDRREGCVHVTMTIYYPHKGQRNSIRITSIRIF